MRQLFGISLILLLLNLVLACTEGKAVTGKAQGDTVGFAYAQNIVVVRYASYTKVSLVDPWNDGHTLCTYVLVADSIPQEDLPECAEGEVVVRVPLKKCVVFNTAHASLLQMLGADSAIRGVCDLRYMQLPEVHRRVKTDGNKNADAVADCGDGMSPDIEKIIELEPDALLLSPFENSGSHGELGKLGIPLIECADYMETSALGRAEWMRFYGMLFGCESVADSLFRVVDSCYCALREKALDAASLRRQPVKALTERLTQGTWYVPGGQSSMSKLLQDAGACYAWADDSHGGSLPLTFESVLDKSADARLWVFNYIGEEPLTYSRLQAEYDGYAQFRAFKDRNVWYVNSLSVPYFEEVSFRPDWLLRDYVTLLCPELRLGSPRYLKPLKTD